MLNRTIRSSLIKLSRKESRIYKPPWNLRVPFRLEASFIDQYRYKAAPFGFNGLGELVYRRTYARYLNDVPEIDSISVVAMTGAVREVQKCGNAAESAADLDTLGRLMNRVEPPMRNQAQEEETRWAAQTAARLLKEQSKELEACVNRGRREKISR